MDRMGKEQVVWKQGIVLGNKYEEESKQMKIYSELTEYVKNVIGSDNKRVTLKITMNSIKDKNSS